MHYLLAWEGRHIGEAVYIYAMEQGQELFVYAPTSAAEVAEWGEEVARVWQPALKSSSAIITDLIGREVPYSLYQPESMEQFRSMCAFSSGYANDHIVVAPSALSKDDVAEIDGICEHEDCVMRMCYYAPSPRPDWLYCLGLYRKWREAETLTVTTTAAAAERVRTLAQESQDYELLEAGSMGVYPPKGEAE